MRAKLSLILRLKRCSDAQVSTVAQLPPVPPVQRLQSAAQLRRVKSRSSSSCILVLISLFTEPYRLGLHASSSYGILGNTSLTLKDGSCTGLSAHPLQSVVCVWLASTACLPGISAPSYVHGKMILSSTQALIWPKYFS